MSLVIWPGELFALCPFIVKYAMQTQLNCYRLLNKRLGLELYFLLVQTKNKRKERKEQNRIKKQKITSISKLNIIKRDGFEFIFIWLTKLFTIYFYSTIINIVRVQGVYHISILLSSFEVYQKRHYFNKHSRKK